MKSLIVPRPGTRRLKLWLKHFVNSSAKFALSLKEVSLKLSLLATYPPYWHLAVKTPAMKTWQVRKITLVAGGGFEPSALGFMSQPMYAEGRLC